MERAKQDTAMKILVNLAQRCRWAAQRRRRTKNMDIYWEAYAAWAESWNSLQAAKRIYNDSLSAKAMKLVIDRGMNFSLSHQAVMKYAELSGIDLWHEVLEIPDPLVIYWRVPFHERTPYDDGAFEEWMADHLKERFLVHHIARDDAALVSVVEEMGKAANGPQARLHVVEIPNGINWRISQDDDLGGEVVVEEPRTWGRDT